MLAIVLLTACGKREPLVFDGEAAYAHVQAQCDLGFRPTGSEAWRATGDYIISHLEQRGWTVETQEFTYRGTPVRNVIGRVGEGPVVILGAHYDTRRSADQEDASVPVMGANDGASGVAVLLELARTLEREALQNQVWLAFFDAEDNGQLDGWEWCVGSSHMAANLEVTPEAVVVVDMIGDADQQLYLERNSDAALQTRLWEIAATLGYTGTFIPEYRWAMLDDHVPFAQRGIPAVDVIDFDYPYWHTTQDTPDKVSAESLERVGRVLEVWLEGKGDLAVDVERLRALAVSGDVETLARALDRSVVPIPAGEFLMGDDAGPANEHPQRLVYLDAFEIDRYEVTNVQYHRFLQATGQEPPPYWSGDDYPPGQADVPVVGVTWEDADAYCAWTGWRLPTEAEWERACRSTDGRVYPWGDTWDAGRANVGGAEAGQSRPVSHTEPGAPAWGEGWALVQPTPADVDAVGLRPVGFYPDGASPDGVMDLVGNASEWVADWFNWDGYWDMPDRNPVGLGPEWNRSIRGSSWVPYGVAHWAQEQSRCSARNSAHRGGPDARFGFRCARPVR
ncbi:MAG TPA: SUMF1/EgtB/PvdO family nonheme iron enzyme [Anaerolineae bacterium]|nr:SUMF1/EgtB/PvdO family nonheme iron enzyme [Anaerolineae bacterium]